jgi:hypothetical protein
VQNRGAVVATRLRSLLTQRNIGVVATESRLGGYRIRQRHLGAAIWTDGSIANGSVQVAVRSASAKKQARFVARRSIAHHALAVVDHGDEKTRKGRCLFLVIASAKKSATQLRTVASETEVTTRPLAHRRRTRVGERRTWTPRRTQLGA